VNVDLRHGAASIMEHIVVVAVSHNEWWRLLPQATPRDNDKCAGTSFLISNNGANVEDADEAFLVTAARFSICG
jgi:hypothetical protein